MHLHVHLTAAVKSLHTSKHVPCCTLYHSFQCLHTGLHSHSVCVHDYASPYKQKIITSRTADLQLYHHKLSRLQAAVGSTNRHQVDMWSAFQANTLVDRHHKLSTMIVIKSISRYIAAPGCRLARLGSPICKKQSKRNLSTRKVLPPQLTTEFMSNLLL